MFVVSGPTYRQCQVMTRKCTRTSCVGAWLHIINTSCIFDITHRLSEKSLQVSVDAESLMIQKGLQDMTSDRIFNGVKKRAIKRWGCKCASLKPFSWLHTCFLGWTFALQIVNWMPEHTFTMAKNLIKACVLTSNNGNRKRWDQLSSGQHAVGPSEPAEFQIALTVRHYHIMLEF